MDSTVHPITVGSDPQYRKLNRWTNILPYDHTRVKLKVVDGDEKCSDDYINANFLVGYRTSKDYIATQGPLTATIPDFWRMVWEQESSVLVMLSAFQEVDPVSLNIFISHMTGYTLIYQHITPKTYSDYRYVKHFFFKSWTDHKADISPSDLINFVNTVRDEAESHPPGPIVVHCSAGVGRTGTFIAVDYFCRYIKELSKKSKLSKITDVMGSLRGSWVKRKSVLWEDSPIDVYGRIIALRDCRRYMVQTKSQYAFIYDTVMELIRRGARGDDLSESGCDTESCLSEPLPAAGTSGTSDAVYDDVDVLKQ
ncbi:hypothetical protein EGW08_004675 [Elysia chlorotica]|uniref:Protein-tyrosine-phosphatase n=1 Tax=Elysia chlorotica TaxID=188477 RepID=A0A433U144_ELYCH|nr:hypothetical protein EGW08_004675 [Elysia chlorotica]